VEPDGVACSVCGARAPRGEMFGAEPELVCPRCADRVRERYSTRLATRSKALPPVLTSLFLAVAGVLFVAAHVVTPAPTWIERLRMGPEVWSGQYWRLISSAFLHAGPHFGYGMLFGILHVGFNAWWLADFGRAIEGAWGALAIGALVAGSAIAASAAQWIGTGVAGVGLSGVVFGLAGFLYPLRRVHPVAAVLMNPATVNSFLLWFVLCIVASQSGAIPIANTAHAGGAVWGLAAGFATRSPRRRLWLPALAVATLGIAFAAQHVALGDREALRAAWLATHRVLLP
jgi:membrane associated rhomboid family serine protease